MQSGSNFLTSPPAEAAPAVTADRNAPHIALSAIDFKAILIIISSQRLLVRPNVSAVGRPALMVHTFDSKLLAASRGMRDAADYTPPLGKERA
jgi:hypothetical protein